MDTFIHRPVELIDSEILETLAKLATLREEHKRVIRFLKGHRVVPIKTLDVPAILNAFDAGMVRKVICQRFTISYWQLNKLLMANKRSNRALRDAMVDELTPAQRTEYQRLMRRNNWRISIQIAKQVHPSTNKENDHGEQGRPRAQSEGLREEGRGLAPLG